MTYSRLYGTHYLSLVLCQQAVKIRLSAISDSWLNLVIVLSSYVVL